MNGRLWTAMCILYSVAFATVLASAADFDGDGKADMGVWRPSDGGWYVLTSSTNWDPGENIRLARQWGTQGDVPLTADFDGDGKADMGVWRPSDGGWYVLTSLSNWDRSENVRLGRQWGTRGDYVIGEHSCAGEESSLSVLALNVRGGGVYEGVDWPTRAGRIADWMRQYGAPDIIALTEGWGWLDVSWVPWVSCDKLTEDMDDYDAIDILLDRIRTYTGVTYRVAYLTGHVHTWGENFQCTVYWVQGMLYNPERLSNRTAQQGIRGSVAHDKVDIHGPHLRRSLPLCDRKTNVMPLESLIDGPPQTDRCDPPRETPSGPAWVVLQEPNKSILASAVRFALAGNPSRAIDVFNVHVGKVPSSSYLISNLVRRMERPFSEASLYYPPLMVNDFNEAAGQFDTFVGGHFTVAVPTPLDDVMAILIGKADHFPAHCRARVAQQLTVPMLGTPISIPGGWPTVSPPLMRLPFL
jgi:hypothetical protein